MTEIVTSIEIAAPPQEVRAKFLDFSQLQTYHKGVWFKSIGPAVPNTPLEAGIKMRMVLDIMTMEPTLLENSPTCFRWGGTGLLGTFNGEHIFRFHPSTKTQGGTTFIQEEKFSGLLSFIIGPGIAGRGIGLRAKTLKGFEVFNKDLKKWCEGS
ncbi:hypothetical protein ABW20_dc0108349 [Dactylellina cionopaga]|nr:hypothetical protein ABW20_dc0108349 [Dactylellina cionopaga]